MRKFLFTVLFALFLSVVLSDRAEAYIDPGTGSFVFQAIIAVIVGSFFALKIYWQKFKALLSSLFGKKEKS